MSALIIRKVGFEDREWGRTRFAERGYVYGTTAEGWAEAYARERARQFRTREGVVLELDVAGLAVEHDPTVALDCLALEAFRVPLPLGPERVRVHRAVLPRS